MALAEHFKQLAESRWFQRFIIGAIFLSVLSIGLETLPGVTAEVARGFQFVERLLLGVFLGEMVVRIGAHGAQPWRFFGSAWNALDFAIVALCFAPGMDNLAVLRLVRLLRVLRLVAPLYESEVIRRKNEELAAAYHALDEEKGKSERLLLNVLPVLIAERLKGSPQVIADRYDAASVLFADIVGFSKFARVTPPEQIVTMLDSVFSRFDHLAGELRLEKIKTIGDCYMVVAGVPEPRADHAEAIAQMALAMLRSLGEFNREQGQALQLRVGLHSGPVVAGVIGRKKFIYDLWGDTVNTASRMESHGVPDRVQVTEEFSRLLADKFHFEERGPTEVKGIGTLNTFFLTGEK
jgi:class 3 adenylate cyclase